MPPFQLCANGSEVDALALGHQIDDAPKHSLVRIQRKILCLQLLRRIADSETVQQHRAQDRHLRVYGAGETVCRTQLRQGSHRGIIYRMGLRKSAADCWKPGRPFGLKMGLSSGCYDIALAR